MGKDNKTARKQGGPMFAVPVIIYGDLTVKIDADVIALINQYKAYAEAETGNTQPLDRIVEGMLKSALELDDKFKKSLSRPNSSNNGNGGGSSSAGASASPGAGAATGQTGAGSGSRSSAPPK